MRVDLCYYWSSFAATFANILNDSEMSFLTKYPLGLCFHGLVLLGMNFFIFSTFCVLIFIVRCLGSKGRERKGPLIVQYQGGHQIPYVTCLIRS